jgi:hypothetical protein
MSGPTIRLRGFLPDECNTVLGESVRGAKVFTYEEVGLGRGTKDPKVLEHARSHGAIVITRNSSHFSQAARAAARDSTEGKCHAMRCQDGIGLVTVHDSLTAFHFANVTKALRLGKHVIDWEDVFMLNLWVHINPQHIVDVRLLPRCVRCMRAHVKDCERCAELGVVELYEAQQTHRVLDSKGLSNQLRRFA